MKGMQNLSIENYKTLRYIKEDSNTWNGIYHVNK